MEPSTRLFGRRKGRPLRVRKSGLMQTLLPQVQITLPENGALDVGALFSFKPKAICLEIGFGGGEHLAGQAEKNPDLGFIGCEPFVNGVAGLLDHLDARQIKNVRVYASDARHVLDALPEGSVDRCFVLFADPWPKKRHEDRRFIGPENLPRLVRAIRKGGELRLATDDAGLTVWMRESVGRVAEFQNVHDAITPPADWIPTRYEQKGIAAGRQPTYFIYKRA